MSYSNTFGRAGLAGPLLVALLALLAGVAAPARAQAPADARWLPWLGCWETMAPAGQRAVSTQAQLCIHSRAGTPGVTFANLVAGKVLGEHEVVADGARHPVAEGGCRGWETATWSRDARRVFRRTELDCDGGVRRTSTGVIAFLPDDEWVEVDAAGLPNNRGVRVVRYRPMAPSAAAATGLLPRGEDLAIQTARAAAAAPLLASDVVEASRRIDPEALQALVYQRGNGFALDARAARQLAEARVPSDVIDLMVALSYPDYFDVERGTTIALRNEGSGGGGGGNPRGPGPWGGWGCYAYDRYDYAGYGYPGWIYSYPLAYGMYNPCWGGYGPYGGMWGGGWGWYGPYGGIVDVGGNGNGGKIVKGHGYSPPDGSGSTGRSARPKGGSASPGGSASVGKSGGSGSSSSGRSGSSASGRSGSSGGSSSGSSSSGRTAKPRGH